MNLDKEQMGLSILVRSCIVSSEGVIGSFGPFSLTEGKTSAKLSSHCLELDEFVVCPVVLVEHM